MHEDGVGSWQSLTLFVSVHELQAQDISSMQMVGFHQDLMPTLFLARCQKMTVFGRSFTLSLVMGECLRTYPIKVLGLFCCFLLLYITTSQRNKPKPASSAHAGEILKVYPNRKLPHHHRSSGEPGNPRYPPTRQHQVPEISYPYNDSSDGYFPLENSY